MNRIILLVGILMIATLAVNAQVNTGLVPVPKSVEYSDGEFVLTPDINIKAQSNSEEWKAITSYLADGLELFANIKPIKKSKSGSTITLTTKGANKDLGPEGYELNVTPKGIEIKANSTAGVFYGVVTLLQLLPTEPEKGEKIAIPAVAIKDQPRFSWRGMHLDVCRHFFPAEFVKRYIDLLAMHKMNTFHWHLTEDQGWRIEIKRYPKLTEIGAWRVDHEDEPWNDRSDPKPGEKATYGGFYTQEEVKEIVQYAADRFITVVPEIEMPGHSVAAMTAYPELSCVEGPFFVMPGGYWPPENIYCAGKETTFEFLENVLDEVLELFPSEFIHIGGDEAFKSNWEKCPDCQARIKAEGLKDEAELQSYFIKRIEKYLDKKGRRLIGWDEILEGGLPPKATVMSWRGIEGGIEAAKQGHDVVMSPSTHCYLDKYQAHYNEPLAIGGFIPMDLVYFYEPIPEELEEDQHHHILGVQGNVWTEYMPNGLHVEYMALPRMCALAEVGWSPAEKRNWADFTNRMAPHYDRLDILQVNYRPADITGFESENVFTSPVNIELAFPRPNATVHYTLDGSEPGPHSPVYEKPIHIDKNITLRAAAFRGVTKVSKIKEGKFTKQTPLEAVKVESKDAGLEYHYFPETFDSIDQIGRIEHQRSGVISDLDFPPNIKEAEWGVIYQGFIQIPETGVYRFYLSSDDGSRLWLHNSVVIDHDGIHGASEKLLVIALEAGLHPVKIAYFQNGGDSSLDLFYSGPGIDKQPVPAVGLFH